jgi:DNA-binding transcriptional ArsR family regulator
VARAQTTADIFNAIAEPRRREIVDVLARGGPRDVGGLVDALRIPQPAVSKHLAVLRKVGAVTVEQVGRRRVYRLEPTVLKPVHDWVKMYEQYWSHKLDRIKERAERLAAERGRRPRTDDPGQEQQR